MQVGTTRRTDEQKISIGLIGRGAIGGTVASIVEQGDVPGITLGAVMTRTPPSDRGGVRWTAMLDELLDLDIDLVVEAAGPEAFKAMVPDVLASGRDVIAVSVAAMADSAVEKAVNRAMAASGARLHVASGAIGGIDALSAARELGLDTVELVQRKPHAAFPDEPLTPGETRIVSSGSAREAAIAFPRNSNIAAAVALAGLGFDNTRVTVVADHAVTTNQADLKVKGQFGQFSLTIENRPSAANPRTASLTAHSVLAALRRFHAPIRVPA